MCGVGEGREGGRYREKGRCGEREREKGVKDRLRKDREEVKYSSCVPSFIILSQITSECLILRRFPDEKISTRLWNDRISAISNNDRCATVTIHYRDNSGECKHHFHSKEVCVENEIFCTLIFCLPSCLVSQSLRVSTNFSLSGNNFKLVFRAYTVRFFTAFINFFIFA